MGCFFFPGREERVLSKREREEREIEFETK